MSAEVIKQAKLSQKTYWVTYGLQELCPEKFLQVVQKILEGKYILLRPPQKRV